MWKGLNCATSSSRLFSRVGVVSRCLIPVSLLELALVCDSCKISHRKASSWALCSSEPMALWRVYITSSGRRSAEFPFSQGSLVVGVVKMLLKASVEEGGGMVVVTESGRCREKNLESVTSGFRAG